MPARLDGLGLGESLGRVLEELGAAETAEYSLLLNAYRNATPVTVHVAIGTDTPHTHPAADGASIGAASLRDFQLLCSLVSGLDEGGVYLNVGSAVVMPEVFLKAVASATRNVGTFGREFYDRESGFPAALLLPRMNVVQRPHAGSGGK